MEEKPPVGMLVTTVLTALISAIASLGVAWITSASRGADAAEKRLDEKAATVTAIQSSLKLAEQDTAALKERLAAVGQQTTDLKDRLGAVSQQTTDLRSQVQAPQKVCSAYTPEHWRDSILVPASWSFEQCRAFQMAVGATVLQLGCISGAKVSLGRDGGGIPEDNSCKW
jgi:hypothetical protein